MRFVCFLLSASALAATPAPVLAQDILFKPIVEARLRYEAVDQQGLSRDADAVTMRVRAGGELSSGPFAFLAEAEGTLAIDESYNSGVNATLSNGKGLYPVIADPETVEVNRVQIQYRTTPLVVTVGRQRINLDDQRFIGSVAWRQNEQTFDALRVEYMGVKSVKLDLTYAISARTIWGIDGSKITTPPRPTQIDGDNLFANLSYKTTFGILTGFAYLIDEDEGVPALLRNSSKTFGARFTGSVPLAKKVRLSYLASYARQSDYAKNPVSYGADYVAAELGLDVAAIKLTGGYELLGSDGEATGSVGGFAFQTPFATLHKFNGWADKFLTTPVTGIQDHYVGIGYTMPKIGKAGPLVASFIFHRFSSDRLSIHYGDEYNAQLTLKLDKRVSALVKYADYRRKGVASYAGDADTKKLWAQIDYAF